MKTCLITGANGKIGLATVKKFMEEGYFVVAIYNRREEDLFAFKNSLTGEDYYRLIPIKCDLTCEQEIIDACRKIEKDFKHIDVLVNNAGVALNKLITETTTCEWDSVFNANIKSAFILTNKLLPKMIERKSGKIVNVSSIWGKVGASMEVCYSASKSALIGYTKALAKEVGVSGINVNCVCPGVIDTDMNSKLSKEDIANICAETPLGRIGTPDEVAHLIYFLASEKSNFITGECITIDGGLTI
ncbi:MAG: SDR family oxidoreductase [Clostridia bacterium]|nr:SDR family oxidoreductase [Clostridia bacterium]